MKNIPGYGRSPLHLLGVIFCYSLAIYAAVKLFSNVEWWIALAFPAGVAVHDFVIYPLYSKADRALTAYQLRHSREDKPVKPWINHVRVPAVIIFLLLLCYFPIILRLVAEQRPQNTGLSQDSYLYRWLIVSAVLVAGSALGYFLKKGKNSIPVEEHDNNR